MDLALLAQQEGGKGAAGLASLILPFVVIGALFYFLLVVPQKRDQKRRQQMLSAVKKNDRVLTIGGIYGVVTNVQVDTDEITIKVDENTNTKLRLSLGSIARVLNEESAEEKK